MKYLFFDIECSNCFNNIGKMCEFGYVVTDENFKIITKNCYKTIKRIDVGQIF